MKKWLLIIFGSLTWSLTMIKSGWSYSLLGTNGSGLGFWGANGHDGIWHIALAESLASGSLQMPIFAGAKLQNYHIGFDLFLAFLHKVTFIPIANLYFQILPPILALSIGLLVYLFTWNWERSQKAAWWATFFVYFGGSLGWLLTKGESSFWSQQGISTLINPPFALSLVLLLVGLILLMSLEKKFTLLNFMMSILVFGILIEIKAYAGILTLGGLLVSGLYIYFLNKKSFLIKIFICALVLSIILYLPLNHAAASLLVFQPFWFLESMMGFADRINWMRFYSAMQSYRSGHNFLKGVPAYLVAFVIFCIGNMGTRVAGGITLFQWLKNIKRSSWLQVFIVSVIGGGIVIPMVFVQTGTPWNTIQFFYYSLFFSSILAGIAVSHITQKVVLMFIVILTIPTTLLTLKDVYIPNRPPAMLGIDEMSALNFLSREPGGIVLTHPFDEEGSKNAENNPPRPLYLYASTAYVTAFSKHQTFLEDEINLDITGFDWQQRRGEVLSWYQEKDFKLAREFLTKNSIKYIYWIKTGQSPLDLTRLNLENIYENNLVTLYKVD